MNCSNQNRKEVWNLTAIVLYQTKQKHQASDYQKRNKGKLKHFQDYLRDIIESNPNTKINDLDIDYVP